MGSSPGGTAGSGSNNSKQCHLLGPAGGWRSVNWVLFLFVINFGVLIGETMADEC